jgi:hypothetical protein
MTLFSIALFVHVAGAMLVFVLLTIEGFGPRAGAQLNRILGPISALAILVPGFYLAAQTGWHPWTAVGLVSYVVIAGLGAYTGISVMRGRMSAPAARVSWLVRIGLAAGVLFDMTVKPDAVASLLAVVVAVVVAVAAALPAIRSARASA